MADIVKIPFSKIKIVSDYIRRKLDSGYVVLGVLVDDGRIYSVQSFWKTELTYKGVQETYYKYYEMYPILKDSDSDDPYYGIRDEEETLLKERELRGMFRYKPVAYINAMDPSEKHQEYWFTSKDKANCYGPLELELIEKFMESHPTYDVEKD